MSATPTAALALETAKCSAKPNGGGSSDVLGGQETRITWEGQASADESVASVSLTLPEGTSYSTDDARLTLLSGDDLMTRERPKTTVSSDGQTVTFALDEAAPAGSYVRLELYKIVFPIAGGDEQISGSYTLTDGSAHDISDVPAITVTGTSFWD